MCCENVGAENNIQLSPKPKQHRGDEGLRNIGVHKVKKVSPIIEITRMHPTSFKHKREGGVKSNAEMVKMKTWTKAHNLRVKREKWGE